MKRVIWFHFKVNQAACAQKWHSLYRFHDSLCFSQRPLSKCLFLILGHNWFLHSFAVIIVTCHSVYRSVIMLSRLDSPLPPTPPANLFYWGLGSVKCLWSSCSSLFSCLWRYDEAGKDYDAILQDDPTNTVSSRKERGKPPPLGPAVALFGRLWNLLRGFSVSGASPTPSSLPDLNHSADQLPINRTNEKCFGGLGSVLGVDAWLQFSDGHVGSWA